MKVTILHQHFRTPETGGAIRSYYLAKALAQHSVGVTVITTHNKKRYRKECLEGIEIHYYPVSYDNRFGFSARSFSFLKYVAKVIFGEGYLTGSDLVYVISTPLTTGLAALWLKKRKNVRYIFEVGDLWPDAPIQLGFINSSILKTLLYKLEKLIYKQASSVVALSEPIKKAVLNKCSDTTVHLVPNMADTDYFKPEQKDAALEEKFKVSGKFVVSYIGAVGFANGLDYLLECARASQRSQLNIHFLLCGEGAMVDSLKSSAQRLSLNNISFLGFKDRDGVKEVMNVTDAAFICYKHFPILETGSPNKYFDGLASGKLVITNFGGWIKEEIESTQCGIALDPRHPTDFVKKVSPFLGDLSLLHKYQSAARALAESKYSRHILGRHFVDVIKATVNKGRRL